ncbi:alpha-ketoglutarate-dependent dioxygenase AlkB [Litchfieldella qijiaojingensis]|uniref:Alpha-ketoglutarate-dependent dioxygenase AlkB n=1 Tax=Litchfieldella qijiaojingensis TaxID=980347 RepID=A0ABQ2YEJ1_9GAMM|nr:alpha-ketoglutarate-dependent dioxygenase AlkB [Halomonas qijiaojingensis]GGX79551.1 alpha-ketoglutarate-dependent dioxygenase AlkB [Halomonas qijiaojingensis]
MQYHDDSHGWQTMLDDPPIWRFLGVLGDSAGMELLRRLDDELSWQRPSLRLYGRDHPVPRQQVWMGDPNARYRYSGQVFHPTAWHPAVEALCRRIEALLEEHGTPARFNSVLLNRYASGEERLGWHSDDEPALGPDPVIAAVSLGAERPLRMRWRDRHAPAFNLWLPHDSLLVMGPGTQRHLQHALLPRRLPGLRISLTFRWIHPSVP